MPEGVVDEAWLTFGHARGREAWPSVEVSPEALRRHVLERAPTTAEQERLHMEDLYIACACTLGDARAIAAVDERLVVGLPGHLARRGFALHLAEEVVQSMRERLFVGGPAAAPRIAEYSGRGSLLAWLRVSAARAASNARRDDGNRAALLEQEGAAEAALPAVDQELAVIVSRYGPAFRAALRDAFDALAPEERSVLRLHFEEGLSLDAVGRMLGVSRATVGRRMLAGRQRILDAMLTKLGERLSATPDELLSILGVVGSKLDVSLAPLLRSR